MDSTKGTVVDRTNKALAVLAIMRLIEKKRKEHVGKKSAASKSR